VERKNAIAQLPQVVVVVVKNKMEERKRVLFVAVIVGAKNKMNKKEERRVFFVAVIVVVKNKMNKKVERNAALFVAQHPLVVGCVVVKN
jgi:hypothetical protein